MFRLICKCSVCTGNIL
ncbi:hypothetical protein F383_35483 [Gossypium arboreum]|uniref:Uncharacterized protein n=1 Tax=Gossypium arboreum TaxID=29729 RepID=A0A0B0N947_GOSAR|nr:hypothetical protein F383_35483 [Gossypium arboreum]